MLHPRPIKQAGWLRTHSGTGDGQPHGPQAGFDAVGAPLSFFDIAVTVAIVFFQRAVSQKCFWQRPLVTKLGPLGPAKRPATILADLEAR